MNIFASDILFYVFGALAVILSLMVVFMRNPLSLIHIPSPRDRG